MWSNRNVTGPAYDSDGPDSRGRVPLFVGGACGSFRIYRGDVARGACANGDQTDGAGVEHSGREHRYIPILEGRTFYMAPFLAVRGVGESIRFCGRIHEPA